MHDQNALLELLARAFAVAQSGTDAAGTWRRNVEQASRFMCSHPDQVEAVRHDVLKEAASACDRYAEVHRTISVSADADQEELAGAIGAAETLASEIRALAAQEPAEPSGRKDVPRCPSGTNSAPR